jgi:outer membrane protein X
MMKKVIFSALFVLAALFSQAQEEGKFRVGLNLGVAIPSGGIGFMGDIEAKYNLNDRMNVGLRLGNAAVIKNIETEAGDEFESAEVSANGSYLGTFDYYFPTSGSFTPFVGGGLGLFTIAAVAIEDGDDENDFGGLDADSKFGGIVRGGFEAGKFRLTLEYDLIPESSIEDVEGNEIGTISNGYFGFTLGFFVGGGRW